MGTIGQAPRTIAHWAGTRPFRRHWGVMKVCPICQNCKHTFMWFHVAPLLPSRILTKLCLEGGSTRASISAERINHPSMLIVLYFQNRIEIDSAARNGTEIYSTDGAEIHSTKRSRRKIHSTGSRNRFHETAPDTCKKKQRKVGAKLLSH